MVREKDFIKIEESLRPLNYEALGRVLDGGYVIAMSRSSGNFYEIRPGMKARMIPDIIIRIEME